MIWSIRFKPNILIVVVSKGNFLHIKCVELCSGIFGNGLAVMSKHPIVETRLEQFPVNGHPLTFHGEWMNPAGGDWFVGKAFVRCRVQHPSFGLIDIFVTHVPLSLSLFCHIKLILFHSDTCGS